MDNTKKYILENYVEDLYCNRCGNAVLKSHLEKYEYQCMSCDEDLLKVEVHFEKHTVAEKIGFMLENEMLVRELLCLDD